jgi:filamentous hemagglutinin family protein
MKINRIAYATTALGLAFAAALPGVANANPTGGSVAAGTATITNSPLNTDINQSSNKAVINWSSFNIAPNETTSFHQPGASSVALNRIGDANPSSILGALNANGQLMLINPNGMMFGTNSQVNVGGLVATTANISDANFMSGNYKFNQTGDPNAAITNNGHINVADGGYAALVAPTVNNNGTITANLGKVALGGADSFVLDLTGDNLISFAVPGVSGQRGNAATVNNNGSVIADGGKVLLTAKSAKSALDSAINSSGLIQAHSAVNHNGQISLVADNIDVGGTMDVHGGGSLHGGTIDVQANKNLSFSGQALAGSDTGTGGTVNLTGKTMQLGGTIDTDGSAGMANIVGTGNSLDIDSNGAYTVASGMDNGGTVNLKNKKTINLNNQIDTSSQDGDGSLHFLDNDGDGHLTANLNEKIILGPDQTLTGEADKVNVGPHGGIQNGVDVASVNGSQVNVAAGDFNENVNVYKDKLDLRGNNWNVPAGSNPGSRNPETNVNGYVNVTASHDKIRGLTVNGGMLDGEQVGINLDGADHATVANNIVDNSGGDSTGIALNHSDHSTVKNNTVQNFDVGIDVAKSDHTTVEGNLVAHGDSGPLMALNSMGGDHHGGHGGDHHGGLDNVGIRLTDSNHSTVKDNTVQNFDVGIDVAKSKDTKVVGNTVTYDTGGSDPMMALGGMGGYGGDHHGNDSHNGGNHHNGDNNDTGNVGIRLTDSDDSSVKNNTIQNYDTGIEVDGSANTKVRGNIITMDDHHAGNDPHNGGHDGHGGKGDDHNGDDHHAGNDPHNGGHDSHGGKGDDHNGDDHHAGNDPHNGGHDSHGGKGDDHNGDDQHAGNDPHNGGHGSHGGKGDDHNGDDQHAGNDPHNGGHDSPGGKSEGTVGIRLNDSPGSIVNNNTVDGYDTGFKLTDSSDVKVKNNTGTNLGTGLDGDHVDDLVATGNTLTGKNPHQGDGIVIRDSDNVKAKLSNNTVSNFRHLRRLINTTES